MFGFVDEAPVLKPDFLIGKISGFPENIIITWSQGISNSSTSYFGEVVRSYNVCPFFSVQTFNVNGILVGFVCLNPGAPLAAFAVELLRVMGAVNFFCVGSCGVLDKKMKSNLIVPLSALRDEGTSFHYVDSEEELIRLENSDFVKQVFKANNILFEYGNVWTTDAVFRETETAINQARDRMCVCVDMECSAVQAVCKVYKLNLFYFFFRGDTLFSGTWTKGKLKKNVSDKADYYLDCLVKIIQAWRNHE